MSCRNKVLAFLCALSVITFVDRLAIAVAEPGVRSDLGLSPSQWGWVLSAYVLGNALFEIPSGALGDKHGQRRELTRIVGWWSVFTAATGWCRSFWQIVSARFLFGVGAAGAYPNAAGVVARWFPRQEHARAQGFIWAASRFGGALAPLLLVPLAHVLGWRAVFWVLGIVGVGWAIAWWMWFRTDPADMPGITAHELDVIHSGGAHVKQHHAIPWAALLRLRNLNLLVVAYFWYGWGSWFFFGWFATWLVRGAHFTSAQMGVWASLPFFVAMLANLVGGFVSRHLVMRVGAVKTYRALTSLCLLCGSALLLAMSWATGHAPIVILATLAFGVMDLMLPSAWAMCMRLGGDYGGTATALMNTAGNLGGWVSAVLFGYVVKATGNYELPLRCIAIAVLAAAVLFACVDVSRGMSTEPALD
ncbi:Predicted arabinose efflux permease, MFS family [Bryocella elongata]|uniref:Predicted arabinose efflux permease, MFS family n=1 Tax=Bryocella elongata TaxID=863522 RepID=A0A1H6AYP9_9BACT|nr:MFS transporter [Bryocella elongata]SEG52916.1 Predicted arabinose efflux permease, MFS family [Bryocella elongata]